MHISFVKIKNYRGIKADHFEASPFTCAIGENNAGKSTILLATSLFFSGTALGKSDFYNNEEPIEIEITFTDIEEKDINRLSVEHRERIKGIIEEGKLVLTRFYSTDGKSEMLCSRLSPKDPRFSSSVVGGILKGKKGKDISASIISLFPEYKDKLSNLSAQKDAFAKLEEIILELPAEQMELKLSSLPTGIENSITKFLPELIYIAAVKDLKDDVKSKESATFGKLLSILMKFLENSKHFEEISESFNKLHSLLNVVRDAGNETAFITKTNGQLLKGWWLFKIVSSPVLVKTGKFFIKIATAIHFPINWLIKPTIYSHFCGGETLDECAPVVELLAQHNVKSILDYSVEGKETEEDINHALEETIKAIHYAAKNENIPYAVFKPTAFAPFHILEKASANELNTAEEKNEALKFEKRMEQLFQTAFELDKPIMIDAEESWVQAYIDDLVEKMMQKYNRKKAIVFNTLQMYRHDRLAFLEKSLSLAEKGNYFLGIKLVRGAYMEKERVRAAKMNYPSPIYPDKAATDQAYDDALSFCIRHIDRITVFNGTHNEASCAHLIRLMKENNLAVSDQRIYSSQLFGMSDHISFNMAKEGYNVAKYIPFGPIKHVLPYLIRRAEENTSIAGQTGRELSLLTSERKRRKTLK